MTAREVVGGELRRDTAPAAGEAGADHRQCRRRTRQQPQRVREQAREGEAEQHERDREILRAVAGRSRRRGHACADHADHDRGHREVLAPSGVLAEHSLREEHQHEQPGGERRLHDDERSEQQRDYLQRPAEDRQPCAEQPAGTAQQAPGERETQMLAGRRVLRVECLQRDP